MSQYALLFGVKVRKDVISSMQLEIYVYYSYISIFLLQVLSHKVVILLALVLVSVSYLKYFTNFKSSFEDSFERFSSTK